ncbi:T9SS type A sorting domain-containing protein [Hymenobacter gummosus]|uniref:T9SS type A sorting domain-containing protein n=1 Tax=Hymenobacter gummosus TaxID=1776032 RepID=A0A3S0J9K7_9BACT|nr:T9SS type A sorting domain-containing protein [Hymenobacter gummosus]RTQ49180.1 T9SS type A sorting domain-containing protein [Hymenobacter gummosus]
MKTTLLVLGSRALLLTGLLALPMFVVAQAPAFDQAQTCGQPLNASSQASPNGIVADTQGNTYVAGSFTGTVSFGATTLSTADADAFVAKRDASGTWLWAVRGGGPDTDACQALAMDTQGNAYVAGHFARGTRGTPATATFGNTVLTTAGEADAFVAKLDGNTGQWLWAQSAGGGNSFSGADDLATHLAYDGAGGLFVGGTFSGPVSRFGPTALYNTGIATSTNRRDLFIAHLNATTGAWDWAQSAGYGPGHDGILSLVSDGWSNAYLSAYSEGALTFGTSTLPYSRGSALAKVDAIGQWQWAQTLVGSYGAYSGINGPGVTEARALALDGSGHLYVAGFFTGATARLGATTLTNVSGSYTDIRPSPPITYQHPDAFIGRLNAGTGTWQWAQRTGGAGQETMYGLLIRGHRLYISGGFGPNDGSFGQATLTSTGQQDAVVAALDTAGTWLWNVQIGGTGSESIWPVSSDAAGRLHLIGASSGSNSISLPPLSLAAAPGSATYFLARMSGGALPSKSSDVGVAFQVYPNPARDQVTVQGLPPSSAVQVLDALGRRVAQGVMPRQGPLRLVLPAQLPAGLYVLQAQGQSQKLIIE